ncbi:taste receptor type 2 member 40-like, partial [Latimeria chalumnae]
MSTVDIVNLGVAMIIIVIGCLGNTFIILVFILEYRRSRTLQPYELIITLMAACNVMTELICMVWYVVYFFDFCTYFGDPIYKVTDSVAVYFAKTDIWLTAWLCFVYCVKIVKVNWRMFMRLKRRLFLVVKYMIVGTLLLCILLAFPVALLIKLKFNSTDICQNYYMIEEEREIAFLYTSLLSMLTSFLPLVLMLVSSLGIVIFLCLHSRNMDKNITAGGSTHIKAHTSVTIMLLCLIALFITCAGTAMSCNLQVAS